MNKKVNVNEIWECFEDYQFSKKEEEKIKERIENVLNKEDEKQTKKYKYMSYYAFDVCCQIFGAEEGRAILNNPDVILY